MSEGDHKYFRDPVHGFIEVNPLERKLIDLPIFQRLRYIKQLGCTYLVYHGAEHSRFSHSLGVMHVAGRILEFLNRNSQLGLEDDVVQLVRLAALLHDIGHPPFSHCSEIVLRRRYGRRGHHMSYSEEIIRHSDVGDLISSGGYDPQVVADIVVGRYPNTLINQLLDSEMDADRMDYLLRDSLFCGVQYGTFDIDRLMISLRAMDGRLVVHEKGEHALLGYMLAHFYMYAQVYTHRTRRAADLMIENLFERLLGEAFQFPPSNEIVLDEFVFMDDVWFLGILRRLDSKSPMRELAKMLIERRLLKQVDGAEEFVYREVGKVSDKFVKLRMLVEDEDKKKRLSTLAGVSPERIIVDLPTLKISEYEPLTGSEPIGSEAEQIYISCKDGRLLNPFADERRLFYDLGRKQLQIVRIYTYPTDHQRVSDATRRYLLE